jgi:hypothetical protein
MERQKGLVQELENDGRETGVDQVLLRALEDPRSSRQPRKRGALSAYSRVKNVRLVPDADTLQSVSLS